MTYIIKINQWPPIMGSNKLMKLEIDRELIEDDLERIYDNLKRKNPHYEYDIAACKLEDYINSMEEVKL